MCSTHSNKYTAASSPAQRHFTASEVRPPGRIFGEFAIIPSLSLSTFRLCIGHMLASCIYIRPRCTQRSRLYAVAHIFYFVLCTRNPRQRSKLEICQRFEAWPPRHPRGMYSQEQFSPENRSGAVRECHVSPPATVEILLFFSFFGEWKSQVVSKFHKLV